MAVFVVDLAAAIRGNDPCTAKLMAEVVIFKSCDAPGASVTLFSARPAASAPGPANDRS